MSNFSIRWLLLAVAYVALCIAALLNANEYWRDGFDSAAILLLLAAVLGVILCTGQRRAFWIGWLVFGLAWFIFAFGAFEFSRVWRGRLITTTALDALHERMFSPTTELITREEYDGDRDRFSGLGARFTGTSTGVRVTYVYPGRSNFTGVGNAILGIPFAWLGAVIATCFWRRRERER